MAAPKTPKPFKGEKIWREAINRAVCRLADGKVRALDQLANSLINAAIEGDVSALKEIGDRLDGKPTQMVGGDENAPIKHDILVRFLDALPNK